MVGAPCGGVIAGCGAQWKPPQHVCGGRWGYFVTTGESTHFVSFAALHSFRDRVVVLRGRSVTFAARMASLGGKGAGPNSLVVATMKAAHR